MRILLIGAMASGVLFGSLACTHSAQSATHQSKESAQPDVQERLTQIAIQASKKIDLHEGVIVGSEQLETAKCDSGYQPCSDDGYYCNIHVYNRAFHYEAQAMGACHVVEGTIAKLNGTEIRIGGDETVYYVWVSIPVENQ